MYKVIKSSTIQGNEYYDPRKSNNGGGYDQPITKWDIVNTDTNRVYSVTKEDTSCGDFGSRIWYQITADNKEIFDAYLGSMLDADQEYVNIANGHETECESIAALCGFGYVLNQAC